jgi:DNA gyrase/topoisomerase IV subunit B
MQRTDKYKRKNAIDHVLDRPDTYVGSKRNKKNEEYILIKKNGKYYIHKKEITYSPALVRIFVEVLSNAIDPQLVKQLYGMMVTIFQLRKNLTK